MLMRMPTMMGMVALAILSPGTTGFAHEFRVTPGRVTDGQKLVFQWKIDGDPTGVPWINIYEAGHIGDEEKLWDYWRVNPHQGQKNYHPNSGIRPQEKHPFPMKPGKYQAILRMWIDGTGWGEQIGTVGFEIVGTLTKPSAETLRWRRAGVTDEEADRWRELGYRWKHPAGDLLPFPHYGSLPLVHDPDAPVWAYLQFRMRKALGDLARLYMSYHPVPPKGSMTTYNDSTWHMGWWPDYVVLTGDDEVRDYCYAWRDSFIHSVDNNVGNFSKGYVKRGDIDHQNEDIVRFLSRLWLIDPSDKTNGHAVRRMAPLLGNWVEGVPAWYDYEQHQWRSYWLGTEFVDPKSPPTDGAAFTWLCLLALQAHQMTGDDRYL